jgi:NhaP-type Na+/H+ or K+/H+ antiporter
MDASAQFILTIGSILLLGLVTSTIARRTFLPRVTFLLIFGVIIGRESLNLIPQVFSDHFHIVADMTLLMVGFLLGEKLTKKSLMTSGKEVLWISLCSAVVTTLIVSFELMLFGVSTEISIVLGSIAAATAPAAILDVVKESNYKGKFSNILLSIVAIDDVWALILFAVGISIVKTLNGDTPSSSGNTFFLFAAFKDIVGAMLLGLILGIPAAWLYGWKFPT